MLTDKQLKNNGAGLGKTIAQRIGEKKHAKTSAPLTQAPLKNIIAAKRAAIKEPKAPSETPAPKNFIAKRRAEVALKATQPAEDAQRLKPEDADDTPVERSEAQRPGAMQADAHSDGHGSIAAAVASPQGKQPSD